MTWFANPGWRTQSRAALDAAPSGGAYTGPGDVVGSAISFWGMRAYNAALLSTAPYPCMDVADNVAASHTINILSTGFVDVAALNALTGPLKIHKLYDQVGTNHLVSTSSLGGASDIPLTLNVINGLPVIDCSSGATIDMETGNVTIAQPFTISWVARRVANTTTFVEGLGAVTSQLAIGWNSAVNQALTYAGNVITGTASDASYHAFQSVFNSTSSDICVDGTSNIADAGTSALSAEHISLPRSTLVGGRFTEFGIWGVAFSSGQKTAMNTNQHGTSGYNF